MSIPNDANEYLPGVIAIPSSLTLVGITNAYPAVATVEVNESTQANTYIQGQSIKLNVPITYGMFQANGIVVTILYVNSNIITLNLDSTQFDIFSIPTGSNYQVATISPNGSRNLVINNDSSQVPFQSLNNIGN